MAETTEGIDARPEHRTSTETIWDEAVRRRDSCYRSICAVLDENNIKALVTQSEAGIYPPTIRLAAWLPRPGFSDKGADVRQRTSLELRFDAKPYYEKPVVVSARASTGRRTITVTERPVFTDNHVAEWTTYTLGLRGKPSNYSPLSDFLANVFLSLLPFVRGVHSNRIARAFRNFLPFRLPSLLAVLGIFVIYAAIVSSEFVSYGQRNLPVLIGIVGFSLIIVSAVLFWRRAIVVSVIDRPLIPPRRTLGVDSWHAVIPDLGSRLEETKKRIADALAAVRSDGIETAVEKYGFRTPNGYEERSRLVVTKGQGIVHLHVYPFGSDLFVGWDSYLNWAQWSETRPISRKKTAARTIEYRGLEEGLYIPNEFDLIDLNSLIEVVHRKTTQTLQALMEEYKIDQEVDFTIIRGDRDEALDYSRYDRRRKQGNEARRKSTQRRWRVS